MAVTVDGKEVPVSLLRAGYVVNPGTRRIEGKYGEVSAVEEVVLAEGEQKSVTLRFSASAEAAAGPPVGEDAPPSGQPEPSAQPAPLVQPEADAGSDGSMQRTLGWVGLGVGGAGLLFGTVTGIIVLSKRSNLDDDGCVNHQCYTEQKNDVDAYNSMRTLSTVGFVVGVVGAAAGATLLLTAPEPGAPGPEVHAWLGVGSAGVGGRF